MSPLLDDLAAAGANGFDLLARNKFAEVEPTAKTMIDSGPQRRVYKYLADHPTTKQPVLLVPPLAVPTSCFDLRHGCSLVEHLLSRGYPVYLVEYGEIKFGDRELGLEHWLDEVIPNAIDAVLEDAGEPELSLVGWCLGGIMALLADADNELPVSRIAVVATPFDFSEIGLFGPIRFVAGLTGGRIVTSIYRSIGGAPAPLVKLGFRASSLDKYLTRPYAIATNLENRETLAQMEAVEHFTSNMEAYPGRTFGQLYHLVFRGNELAEGFLDLGERSIDLENVEVPVLVVAGDADRLAPKAAVHHLRDLLTGSPEVELRTAPGGHLGVLTGGHAERTTWRYLDEFLAAGNE